MPHLEERRRAVIRQVRMYKMPYIGHSVPRWPAYTPTRWQRRKLATSRACRECDVNVRAITHKQNTGLAVADAVILVFLISVIAVGVAGEAESNCPENHFLLGCVG